MATLTNRERDALLEALRTLDVGPAYLHPGYPFDTLTEEQRAKLANQVQLWLDSWVKPALRTVLDNDGLRRKARV